MKIAVIGWYGHQNAGDDRILYCLRRFLADDELLPVNGFAGLKEQWKEINGCDLVLFGGGGLILRGTGKHAPLFRELRPPLACIGISVESVHQDNIDLIEVLKDKCEFILVRDLGSQKAFGHHAKVVVGPDLTFLYPLEIVHTPVRDLCGVNFRPWRYWDAEHNSSFDLFMHRFNRRFPRIEKAYPLRKWRPHKAVSILQRHFRTLKPISLYNEPNRKSDTDVLEPFFDVPIPNFSVRQMEDCGVIVSMRLHGLIFATQLGIPFVSLSYMPKNREFCRSIGLSKNSVELFDLADLDYRARRVKETWGPTRAKLIEMRARNQNEITSLMRQLVPHNGARRNHSVEPAPNYGAKQSL